MRIQRVGRRDAGDRRRLRRQIDVPNCRLQRRIIQRSVCPNRLRRIARRRAGSSPSKRPTSRRIITRTCGRRRYVHGAPAAWIACAPPAPVARLETSATSSSRRSSHSATFRRRRSSSRSKPRPLAKKAARRQRRRRPSSSSPSHHSTSPRSSAFTPNHPRSANCLQSTPFQRRRVDVAILAWRRRQRRSLIALFAEDRTRRRRSSPSLSVTRIVAWSTSPRASFGDRRVVARSIAPPTACCRALAGLRLQRGP